MNKKFSLALFVVLLAGFAFFRCNTDEGNLLTVNLSDSLHVYDSILIVVKTPDGHEQARRMIAKKGFGPIKDGKFQEVLDLGDNPPPVYDIFITTFADHKETKYVVAVTPGEIKKPEVIPDTVKPDTAKPDTAKPKPSGVVVETASPQTLARQGASLAIVTHVLPSGADQSLLFQSSQNSVASVDTNGVVHPGVVGEADIIVRAKADSTKQATLHIVVIVPPKVDSISVSPDTGLLYVGGETLKLTPTVVVEGGAPTSVTYESSDKAIATVLDGVVTAVDTGLAIITMRPLGDSILKAICKVRVVKDAPVLDVGDDRKCKQGETLTFDIKVSQAYGKIAALRWNLDGDTTWDGTTTDSSASPKHRYDSPGLVTAVFYVKDSEGNEVTVTRKIQVGSLAPLVDIVKPAARDTIVNTPSFTVTYKADGVSKTKDFALKEGPNQLVVSETNDGGTGTDTVDVTLDTQAPVVKITSPADSSLTNKASVAVAWTVDGVAQTKNLSEDLTGKQGKIAIIREAVDAAGNKGSTSVTVTRDTVAPLAPVFTSNTTSSPTNALRPTWEWASGGNGGAGVFQYSLDSGAFTQGPFNKFIPTQDLSEGNHTLVVTELDAAGNFSAEARRTIRIQTKGPVVKITSPADGLVTRASSISVSWTVDGNVQTRRTTENLSGKQGSIKIGRDTVDLAGNRGADTVTIIRDTTAPSAPSFTARPSHYVNAANSSPVQWTWSRTGAADDSFLVALNAGTAVKQAGTGYLLASPNNQTYVLEIQEFDVAGNVSSSIVDTVIVDKVAPPAPIVSGTTPTNSPNWTWSAGANSDGNRRYRYKLSTASSYSAETSNTSYAPTLTSGSYTLLVQERDAAGNWSGDGQATLVVDKAGPSLSISSPNDFGRVANFNPQVVGTVSDAHNVSKVEYKLNSSGYVGASRSGGDWNFTANYTTGTNVVWIRAEDEFGNRDSVKINIYKYPNVKFVRKGAGGTGKSWDDAYSELYQALDTTIKYPAGTEIWVTRGKYYAAPGAGSYLTIISSSITVKGGFREDIPSVDTTKRDTAVSATILAGPLNIGDYDHPGVASVIFDGFTLRGDVNSNWGVSTDAASQTIFLSNIKVNGENREDTPLSIYGNYTTLHNSDFVNNNTFQAFVVSFRQSSNMDHCTFTGNSTTGGYAPIDFDGSLSVDGGYFRDNHGDDGDGNAINANFGLWGSQMLTIDNAKVQGGEASIHRSTPTTGTVFYGASNVTIP